MIFFHVYDAAALVNVPPDSQRKSLTVFWPSRLKLCTWEYVSFMNSPSVLWTLKPPPGRLDLPFH